MTKTNPILIIAKEFFNIQEEDDYLLKQGRITTIESPKISILYLYKNRYSTLTVHKNSYVITSQTQLNKLKTDDKNWYYFPTLIPFLPNSRHQSNSSAPYRHYSYCQTKQLSLGFNRTYELDNIFEILKNARIIVVDRFTKGIPPYYKPLYTCFENELSRIEDIKALKIARWYINHYYKPAGKYYQKNLEKLRKS